MTAGSGGNPIDPITLTQAWSATAAQSNRQHARWLLEVASGLDGDEFDAALDQPLTKKMVAHLDAMIARYQAGEPLQYVLGRWQFRHLDLAIDRRVLIPRPETELVAGLAIELARQFNPRRIVDLGTGSGAIGLSLAVELPLDDTEIWLTDISQDALDMARANLAGVGRAARNVRIAAGDWFEALEPDRPFDVIVSNPPYVATASAELDRSVREWEPGAALFAGADGLDHYRQIIAQAPDYLAPSGWLILEIGADQGAAVKQLLEQTFGHGEIRSDLAGHDRIAIAQSHGAATGG